MDASRRTFYLQVEQVQPAHVIRPLTRRISLRWCPSLYNDLCINGSFALIIVPDCLDGSLTAFTAKNIGVHVILTRFAAPSGPRTLLGVGPSGS